MDRTPILAVQEDGGTFDLLLTGEWEVSVDSPYSIRVNGSGTIRSHGHEFRWKNGQLTKVGTSQVASPGLCMFVTKDGELRPELPFK